MTDIKDNSIEVLTDQVEINNERVAGYERAAEQSKQFDIDLYTIFLSSKI